MRDQGKSILKKATPLAIPGVILSEHNVLGDDRGFFFESFNQAKLDPAIAIQWTLDSAPALSAKDQQCKSHAAAEHFA
jgi:dTDP-4-dehydrorhamnose 3,5-epimerase-like enzyme